MSSPQLFLNAKQAKNFDGRHPWVLDRSVVEPTVPLEPGAVVELLHPSGSWIGRGIYNPASRIRVRLYQWDQPQVLDWDWVEQQLDHALRLRQDWQARHHTLDAVRLVNSEGDGLSGLIVDQFAQYIKVHFTSLAMHLWRDQIVAWFVDRLNPQGVSVNVDAQTAKHEGLDETSSWAFGNAPAEVGIADSGAEVIVDLESGQKTGYYLDQRSNRLAAANWMVDGSLLDVCCYQGGFSLTALRHRELSEVVAIDSSQRALDQASNNAQRNGFADRIEFVKADCFDHLQQMVQEGKQFDNVVLDPPRMAGNRNQIQSALRAYHRLNLSAVNLLRPGGTLVTCSCSGRVYREDFWGVLSSVAKRTRRRIQLIEARSADFDHPIDVNCPESDYLKCFLCRVQ